MYTRRPKKPLKFSTGGSVPAEPVDSVIESEPTIERTTPPEPDDAVQRALEAQQRAEEMARTAARERPQTIEERIDKMPGISDAKRQWFREYPRLLEQHISPLAYRAYTIALAEGIEDDTVEMKDRIVSDVVADIQRIERKRTAPLQSDPAHEVELEPAPPETPKVSVAPSPTPRRSVPVSAPVSRDIPSASGRRQSAESQVTLTAAEREIARNSFGTVGGVELSNAQKEALYALNKSRYQQMLANGEYSPQGNR